MTDAQVEQAPSLDDVAADCGVHKARKQRYAQQLGVGGVRVGPGPDRRLEGFQHESDHVKQTDCLELVDGLETCPQHRGLNRQRDHQQRVVAGQSEDAAVGGCEHRDEEQSGEQAGPRLLDPEIEKFQQETARTREMFAGIAAQQMTVDPVDPAAAPHHAHHTDVPGLPRCRISAGRRRSGPWVRNARPAPARRRVACPSR